jgi:IS30 family transposase
MTIMEQKINAEAPALTRGALTSQKEINKVVGRINLTPMKCLGFKTPLEVFAEFAGAGIVG